MKKFVASIVSNVSDVVSAPFDRFGKSGIGEIKRPVK